MNEPQYYEPVVIDRKYLDKLISETLSEILPEMFERFVKKEKKMLRVKEAASYFNVSQPTIYRWVEQGDLKAQKIGKTLYVFLEE